MKRILRIKSRISKTFDREKFELDPWNYGGTLEWYDTSRVLNYLIDLSKKEDIECIILKKESKKAKVKIKGNVDSINKIINNILCDCFMGQEYDLKVSWL